MYMGAYNIGDLSHQFLRGQYNELMRPIREGKLGREPQCNSHSSENLRKLQRILTLNHKTQEKLKKMRDSIHQRINDLSEFITTHTLKIQYPPATSVLSYIKFERTTPHSFREQSKMINQQEAIKNTSERDGQFINKLDKNKKKKMNEHNFWDVNSLPSDPKLIDFKEIVHFFGVKTGLEAYRAWLEMKNGKQIKRPFTLQEDKLIIEKQKRYGDNWEKICQFIDERSFEQIYYEFHNRINPHLKGGRWSLRQSIMLIALTQHFGTKRWAYISQKIIVKSQLQVRERYCNIIDPSIGKNNWTAELEERLIQEAPALKYSWKDLAKLPIFKDKTDNCIWRKYRNIMITKSEQEISRLMPGGEKKGLIQKILTVKEKMENKKQKNKGFLSTVPADYEGSIIKMKSQNNSNHRHEPLLTKQQKIDEGPQPQFQDSLSYIIYDKH